MSDKPIYPAKVEPFKTIGIVAPSSMMTLSELDKVVKCVRDMGMRCKVGRTLRRSATMFTALQEDYIAEKMPLWLDSWHVEYDRYIASGYMAGDPQDRADDINQFFADPDVDAIWCQRGGFGSARIMPYLDYDLIRQHPKQVVGYSDCTNIIAGIYQNAGLVTYHAPMVHPNFTKPSMLDDGRVDDYTWHYFQQFTSTDWQEVAIANPDSMPTWTVQSGAAEGRIVGGNLSVLAHAIGTNYALDTTDKIVFIEETHEHIPYADANLTQLRNAGFFDHIRGLIVGDFLDCHNRTGRDKCQNWGADKLIKSHFADAPFPVLAHVKLGHDIQTVTIPLGAWCQLDADKGEITIIKK